METSNKKMSVAEIAALADKRRKALQAPITVPWDDCRDMLDCVNALVRHLCAQKDRNEFLRAEVKRLSRLAEKVEKMLVDEYMRRDAKYPPCVIIPLEHGAKITPAGHVWLEANNEH